MPVNWPCCSRCWTSEPYRSSWISRSIFTSKHPERGVQPLSTPGMLYLHSLALAITAGKQSCCIAHVKMKRGKDQVHTNISFLSSLDFIFPVQLTASLPNTLQARKCGKCSFQGHFPIRWSWFVSGACALILLLGVTWSQLSSWFLPLNAWVFPSLPLTPVSLEKRRVPCNVC